MSNTQLGLLIGSGITTGAAMLYAARRRRNRSLLARTSRQAAYLKNRALKLRDSAVCLIGKGRGEAERQRTALAYAVGAGLAAYQRAID